MNSYMQNHGKYKLSIENLKINGETVPADDPRNEIFTVGDKTKNKNPGYIYMDELLAGEQPAVKFLLIWF